jgi:hypothetical protein
VLRTGEEVEDLGVAPGAAAKRVAAWFKRLTSSRSSAGFMAFVLAGDLSWRGREQGECSGAIWEEVTVLLGEERGKEEQMESGGGTSSCHITL